MKKIKLLSNVLWLIGFSVIILVITEKIGLINLPLISTEPSTLEEIEASYRCMQLIFCIGYFFIAISIIIKICSTISRNTTEKNKNVNINKHLNHLILSCKIIIVIFTAIIISLSLFMIFLSLIDFSNIPQ